MGGLMAKHIKKKNRAAAQEVMSRLDRQRNNLTIYQQQTEPTLESDRQQAKQLLREGRREEAKTVLRRRRYRQQQLQSSNAQLDKIDQIASVCELAIALNEGESKPKRGKWKSIIKRKFKKSRHNSDTRKHVEKRVDEDIEIRVREKHRCKLFDVQVLDVLNKKGRRKREKVYTKARNGIQKQKEIDKAIMLSFKLETGDEEAVQQELEAILNSSYQLPDIDPEISNEVELPRLPIDVTADIVVTA